MARKVIINELRSYCGTKKLLVLLEKMKFHKITINSLSTIINRTSELQDLVTLSKYVVSLDVDITHYFLHLPYESIFVSPDPESKVKHLMVVY